MRNLIGLDIGGTKIAGGLLTPDGAMAGEVVVPTPQDYSEFLASCDDVIGKLENLSGGNCSVGVGIAGWIERDAGRVTSPNLPFLKGQPFRHDLASRIGREVRLANDANCMALAEAVDGAGAGYDSVLGVILGTGVGSGFVHHGRLVDGCSGMAGEIGHLPLPFREAADGSLIPCACRQEGCVESLTSGGALARLYEFMTGKSADARAIGVMAEAGDPDALRVLDRYYEVVAKAMVIALHTFDPDVIVVSGGVSLLSGLYDEVPKRWGRYVSTPNILTKFLPARHGAMSGIRGAAWLWRGDG